MAGRAGRKRSSSEGPAIGIAYLRARRGSFAKINRELNIKCSSQWKRVPLETVFQVARISGFPVEYLRPDIFQHDPLRAERASHILAHPGNPSPRQNSYKARLTERHTAIWRRSDITTKEATHLIADDIGTSVTKRRLYDLLGPRPKRIVNPRVLSDAPCTPSHPQV